MSKSQEIANLQVGLDMDIQSFSRELSNTKKTVRNLSKDFDVASKSIDQADNKMEAMAQAMTKGNKAFEATEKKLQMQNKQFDDLYKKTEKQKKQYDELSNELKKAEKALDDMARNGDKSSDAYKQQEKSVKDLKKALSDKLELIQKNSHKLQQYSTDIDKTTNDLSKLESSIDDIQDAMLSIDEGADGLSKFKDVASEAGINLELLELGAKAAAIAIAAVFAKNVYDGAISYDNAITDLRLSLGLTEESAKDLLDQLNQITDGGYSVEGIAESVKYLEQRFNLGAKETENLAQSMDLLSRMGYESADVVRFMTSAVNDWGMSHEQALDMIISGEQTGLNISKDWLDTLVEYTPILSTLGVEGEEAFALVDAAVNATGMTTDQAMDMVKEFFLTLTDGSKTSEDAFKDLGLDIEDFKKQIDSGAITSVEAMEKVMQSIMGVSDETERARLLQEIFKGTIEYGSEGVVKAWSDLETSVSNTAGAMDEAKVAYENSYAAMQQDLSNEWNELKQTVGSGVLPVLKEVISFTTKAIKTLRLAPAGASAMFTQMGNDIGNAFDGAYGKVLEFVINTGTDLANLADSTGFDGIAESMREGVENADKSHKELVKRIGDRNKENERLNKEHSKKLEEIWNDTELEVEVDSSQVEETVINLTETYDKIPKEIQTVLKAEDKESKDKALKLYNEYEKLPKEVQTLISADNYKALEGASTIQDVLANIPTEKKVDLLASIKEEGNISAEQLQMILDSLPEEERVKIETQVAGKEEIEQTKKDLDNMPKESTSKVSVDTGDSKKKVQDVKKEVESVSGKTYSTTFKTETSGASKNVTGLKKNIDDYDRKHGNKTKKTTFKTETAQASKNVTGLKNNISSFVNNYAKTFTTTFKVVTKYSTVGSPTAQSSGVRPASLVQQEEFREVLRNSATNTFEPYATPMNEETVNTMTRGKLDAINVMPGLSHNVNLLQVLEDKLKDINNQLDILDKKANNAFGIDKINYIKKQNDLLKQQQQLQHQLAEDMRVQQNELKYFLSNGGFTFADDGSIDNYTEKLLAYEKNLKSLEEKSKNSESDALKAEYDATKEAMDELKKALDEYLDLTFDKIPGASDEWWDLNSSIQNNIDSIKELETQLKYFDESVNIGKYENELGSINKELDILASKLKNLSDGEKTSVMQQQIELYRKKQQELHNLANSYREVQSQLKDYLVQQGFLFDVSGKVANYEHLNSFINSDGLEDVKKALEEYINLTNNEIPGLSTEWWDVENSIKDVTDAIKELQEEAKKVAYENSLKPFQNSIEEIGHALDRVHDKMDLLDKMYENVYGEDKLAYYDKKIALMEQEKKLLEDQYAEYLNIHHVMKGNLSSQYGVQFDDSSLITNYDEILNKYIGHADYDKIKDQLDEYIDLVRNDIPEAWKGWLDLENQIKEANKEKLEVTKQIEDQITDVYKKQVQDRINLIEKELDSRLKALDKEKKAYQDARADAEYEKDYDKQKKLVDDLQKKIDIASKDTSLSGQKKLQELLEQLNQEQEKLEELVQSKMDSDIEDMIDKESDRLTDSADDAIKDLEDKFSDSKIAELVAQALGSGVFTDIEGNVSSLEDALINFAEETGELFGVLGATIEQELITNLQIAIDTFKDLDSILDNLNLDSRSFSIPNVDYSSSRYIPGTSNVSNTTNSKSVEINFNKSLVNIEGNVDKAMLPDIESMIQQAQDKLLEEIVYHIR